MNLTERLFDIVCDYNDEFYIGLDYFLAAIEWQPG